MQKYPALRIAYIDTSPSLTAHGKGTPMSVLLRWNADEEEVGECYRVRLPDQLEDNRGVVCIISSDTRLTLMSAGTKFRARFEPLPVAPSVGLRSMRRVMGSVFTDSRGGETGEPEPRDDLLLQRVHPDRGHEPGEPPRGGLQDAKPAAGVRLIHLNERGENSKEQEPRLTQSLLHRGARLCCIGWVP